MPSPILRIVDSLRNAVTGMGTSRDARAASHYAYTRRLTQQELAAAYKGSGLMRKIVNIPALDMVREWREWEGAPEQIKALESEEKRLGIVRKFHRAEVMRACGGAAFILGLPGNPAEPAPPISKGGLAYVNVVSRWHLTFTELNDDATSPDYGEPVMWRLQTMRGQVEVHPSRVITFRGAPVPEIAVSTNEADSYWGESVIEQVIDAVKDSDAARASFAALLHKARLLRIGIPGLSDLVATPGGEQAIAKRLEVVALAESLHNATIYDAGDGQNTGEEINDATYNFAGAKDILAAYAEFVCAVSDIPATRLLGRAPDGMNSSGDSQQKDWSKKIKAKQELELMPCLDKLDAYLVPSALGVPDGAVNWDFEELDEQDQTAEVARFKTVVEAIEKLQVTNTVPDIAFAKAVQNTLVVGGWLPGLEQALAETPEAERFGIVADPTEGGGQSTVGAGGDPTSLPPVPVTGNGATAGGA